MQNKLLQKMLAKTNQRNFINLSPDYVSTTLRQGYENGLYTVLNVSFARNEMTELLILAIDAAAVCVSGGSACSSGSDWYRMRLKRLSKTIQKYRFGFRSRGIIR